MAAIEFDPPIVGADRNTWGTKLNDAMLAAVQAVNESVTDLEVRAGNLIAIHQDDSETDLGPLPIAPGGSDEGVASYIATPGSDTQTALNAQIAQSQPLNTAVIIGPSLEEQNGASTNILDGTSGNRPRSRGWFHWMNGFLAAQGKGLDLIANKGVGGERWDQMLARFDSDVVALNPAIIFIGSPTNDIGADRTVAQITADGNAMIAKAAKINAKVVVHQIPPRSNVTTPARRAVVNEVNRWIADLSFTHRNVASVDTWTPIADTATGWPVYGMTLDGTHYSNTGASHIGKAAADAVAPLIALSKPPQVSYAVDARRFLDNPTFLNAGAGWSATSTASVAYSKATRGQGNKATITIAGNSSLSSARGILRTTFADGYVLPGDILQLSARFKWSSLVALGGSTPCNPVLEFSQFDATDTLLSTTYSLYSSSSEWEVTYPTSSNTDPWPALPSGEMVLTTSRATVAPTCAKITVTIGWRGAASAVVEVSDLAPLKDPTATIAHPTPDPYTRPATGAAGYNMRWIAQEYALPNGSTVSNWVDLESGLALNHPTPANRPTIQTVAGRRVVRYDGVDDYLYNTATPTYNSRAIVCRVLSDAPATDQGIATSGATGNPTGATNVGFTRRNASGLAGSYWTNSRTATADAAGAWPLGQWFVLTIRHDDGDARTARNGATIATSSAAGGGVLPAAVEQGRRTTAYGRIEIAEDICWPTGLSDAQMSAVVAQLQTNHAPLFA